MGLIGAPPPIVVPVVAAGTSFLALALLGATGTLGLGGELSDMLLTGHAALTRFVHRGCLALSGIACLAAIVFAAIGWSRARLVSVLSILGASAWLGLFIWARFFN
jgi:hypothetical protein